MAQRVSRGRLRRLSNYETAQLSNYSIGSRWCQCDDNRLIVKSFKQCSAKHKQTILLQASTNCAASSQENDKHTAIFTPELFLLCLFYYTEELNHRLIDRPIDQHISTITFRNQSLKINASKIAFYMVFYTPFRDFNSVMKSIFGRWKWAPYAIHIYIAYLSFAISFFIPCHHWIFSKKGFKWISV